MVITQKITWKTLNYGIYLEKVNMRLNEHFARNFYKNSIREDINIQERMFKLLSANSSCTSDCNDDPMQLLYTKDAHV